MEHVIILTEDQYNVKKDEYKTSKEDKEDKLKGIAVEIGIKFRMGTVYYFVVSVDEYVKCNQLSDLKNNEFPSEIILEKDQMNHVEIVNDEEYQTALKEYKVSDDDKEEKEEKEQLRKKDVLLVGLGSFSLEYIFDDDPETVIIRHQQGQTLRVEPDNETKLNWKGGAGEFARWIIEFDGGDKYQRITLQNTKTNKYLRIINDGKDIDVSGDKDDDNNYFKAITDKDNKKNCIKLESCSFSGKFVAVEPEQGIIIGDADNECTTFSFWKEIEPKIGLRFKMADICYEVEAIGQYVKCKQSGDNKEFPEVIYLEKNQLNHVEIIKGDTLDPTASNNPSRTPSARDRVKMFEKKEQDPIKKKETKPAPKKLKKNALNAKFGHMNINPGALKPGSRAKLILSNKDSGNLDQKPKVEQAIITKGKRKKRKKKKVIDLEQTESKNGGETKVAPQLFYDEKAAAKSKKEKEKQRKAAEKSGKNSNNGGDDGDDGQPAAGGGACCVVL